MRSILYSLLLWLLPAVAFAENQAHPVYITGISWIWVLANISYAGMRAQGHPSTGWRIVSFMFGLPGTIITTFAVKEGGERAYGVDIPKKRYL